jgi:ribokinase
MPSTAANYRCRPGFVDHNCRPFSYGWLSSSDSFNHDSCCRLGQSRLCSDRAAHPGTRGNRARAWVHDLPRRQGRQPGGGLRTCRGCTNPHAAGPGQRPVRTAPGGIAARSGVQMHIVRSTEHATGTAFICVSDDAENAITVAPGANRALAAGDLPPLRGFSHLLMQLETPLATVTAYAAQARAAGVQVVLNAAPAQPLPTDLLCTGRCAGGQPGRTGRGGRLPGLGGRVPRTPAGAGRGGHPGQPRLPAPGPARRPWCRPPSRSPRSTPPAPATPSAACWWLHWTVASRWQAALRQASAAAALACTRAGAQSSIPTPAEVTELLRTQPGKHPLPPGRRAQFLRPVMIPQPTHPCTHVPSPTRTKVIYDTDPGVDDAMALYFALAHPAIDVVGITTTFGNVSVEQAATNALYLTALAGRDIPVTKGVATPWCKTPEAPPAHIHGADGLGNLGARRGGAQGRSAQLGPVHRRHGARPSGRDHAGRRRAAGQPEPGPADSSRSCPTWCARSSSWAARCPSRAMCRRSPRPTSGTTPTPPTVCSPPAGRSRWSGWT